MQPVHVINVDIQDNHEEATLGAFLICELCQCVSVSNAVLQAQEEQSGIKSHLLCSYHLGCLSRLFLKIKLH